VEAATFDRSGGSKRHFSHSKKYPVIAAFFWYILRPHVGHGCFDIDSYNPIDVEADTFGHLEVKLSTMK